MTTDLRNETKLHTRKALGRGLAALLPEANSAIGSDRVYSSNREVAADRSYFLCPIDKLNPSVQQPRQRFNEKEIKELADSIKENGLIQPLIVRRRGDTYEIVAGERRWRASKLAGMKEVPVVFKDMSDKVTLQTALVENIQRADLNAIEEAKAYRQLTDEYGLTQEELSKKVGKDRASISNYLRLLKLPDYVQKEIEEGFISTGHAKVLCSVDGENALKRTIDQIKNKELSVRDTEKFVLGLKATKQQNLKKGKSEKHQSLFSSIEDSLREKFKTKAYVKGRYDKGAFMIEYYNKDDFERILSILFE